MSRRTAWIIGFLGVTFLAIGEELYAAFSHDPNILPWTELIVRYIPWPVTAIAIGVLVTWLPLHFLRAYRRQRR
jgi:hypothetical protein